MHRSSRSYFHSRGSNADIADIPSTQVLSPRSIGGAGECARYPLPKDLTGPSSISQMGTDRSMTDGVGEPKRVKFYGAGDLASYWQFEHIAEVIAQFDATEAPPTVVDAIEL